MKTLTTVKACDLQENDWMYFGGYLDMKVGDVETCRDGDIVVRCDYGGDDRLSVMFFAADAPVSIYRKECHS